MERKNLAHSRPATPRNFAARIHRELRRRELSRPGLEILVSIAESLFYASLRTEELQAIACSLVYMNPDNPDPSPPERLVRDRWSTIRLAEDIPVSDSNIAKLAQASDPRSSSFAVFVRSRGKPFIWGLIDQQNRYYDFLNHDTRSGPERPGIFEISIQGPAHLVASIEYEIVTELRINELVNKPIDVLARGPIHRRLLPGIERCIDEVKQTVPINEYMSRAAWHKLLESDYLDSIRRLLLRIRNLGHGGAILVTPDKKHNNLNIKHKIEYTRFRKSIGQRGASIIRETYASDRLFELMGGESDEIPVDLYLQESICAADAEESSSELDGALWFIALLSRVDGAVILTPEFDVKGFGVEISVQEEPDSVFLSSNSAASSSKIREFDYRHFGTRHRSMMRYCNKVEGSVGFVISQDGDVRAITRRRDQLLVWDNMQLQHALSERRGLRTR